MYRNKQAENINSLGENSFLMQINTANFLKYETFMRYKLLILLFVIPFLIAGCASDPDIIPQYDRKNSELVAHLLKLSSKRFYEGAPPLSDEVFPFVLQKGYRSYKEFLIDDGFDCVDNICIFTNLIYVDDSMTQRNLNAYFVHIWMIEVQFDEVQTRYDVEVTQLNFMHRRVDG